MIRSVRAIINGATMQCGMSSTLRRFRPCWDSARSMRFGTAGGAAPPHGGVQKLLAGHGLANVRVILAHEADELIVKQLLLI